MAVQEAQQSDSLNYFGRWGVLKAATGTRVRARMNPREKLMRAVQPSSTARYSTATNFRTFQPCSVPSPDRSLEQPAQHFFASKELCLPPPKQALCSSVSIHCCLCCWYFHSEELWAKKKPQQHFKRGGVKRKSIRNKLSYLFVLWGKARPAV